jgi:hypothetical protein
MFYYKYFKIGFAAIFLFCLIVIIPSCSSLKITTSWKASDAVIANYNKILVLGLTRENDRSIQENMENHFVADLKELGYQAITSLSEYGPKAFENLDEAAALQKLKNSNVDAIITIVLLDKERERKYVPGNAYYSSYGYYYNRFWGYRTTMYRRIYEPGYYVTDTKYFWESNFYDMRNMNQTLVYSVQSQSFDPASSESHGHQYGKLIVGDMVKKNVLHSSANQK